MAGASGVHRGGLDSTPSGRPLKDRGLGRSIVLSSTKRQLFFSCEREKSPTASLAVETWTNEENRALVEFVLFYSNPNTWPKFSKRHKFWKELADFVQPRARTLTKRSGKIHVLTCI